MSEPSQRDPERKLQVVLSVLRVEKSVAEAVRLRRVEGVSEVVGVDAGEFQSVDGIEAAEGFFGVLHQPDLVVGVAGS